MRKKLTTEEFIEKTREIHGDRYDYSRVEYVNNRTKVTIICKKHGDFRQTANSHLMGRGCIKCGGGAKLTTEEFIKRSREKHGDKYDYSKVEYVNTHTKVIITCRKHGDFKQLPDTHISQGCGCPECGMEQQVKSRSSTTEEFIEKAKKKHGNRYDYSKVEYVNNRTKVTIICKEHGDFKQTPDKHLAGRGCIKCGRTKRWESRKLTTEEFIEKAKKKHGDRYDYSKVEYVNNRKKINITCKEHGDFQQSPNSHLNGQGCPECCGTKKSSTEEFMKKSKRVHGDRYDYSKVKYVNNHTKIIITCPEHGDFKQIPACHTQGRGCPECSKETSGWTHTKWHERGKRGNKFKGFTVYLLKLTGNNECFLKAGKTFNGINTRFRIHKMPYNIEVIKTITSPSDGITISKAERQILNAMHTERYTPAISFEGETECIKYSEENIQKITALMSVVEAKLAEPK